MSVLYVSTNTIEEKEEWGNVGLRTARYPSLYPLMNYRSVCHSYVYLDLQAARLSELVSYVFGAWAYGGVRTVPGSVLYAPIRCQELERWACDHLPISWNEVDKGMVQPRSGQKFRPWNRFRPFLPNETAL